VVRGGGATWTVGGATGAAFTGAFGFTAAVVRGGVLTTGGAARGGAVLDATAVGVGGAIGEALAVGAALLASELTGVGWEPPLPQPATPMTAASRNAAPPALRNVLPPALTNALDKFSTSDPLVGPAMFAY